MGNHRFVDRSQGASRLAREQDRAMYSRSACLRHGDQRPTPLAAELSGKESVITGRALSRSPARTAGQQGTQNIRPTHDLRCSSHLLCLPSDHG